MIPSPRFFYPAATKNYLVFTSAPRDSHPNTIKNVTAPLCPSLYKQPNTPLIRKGEKNNNIV
jgi:hypothetical protein